jgi:ribonuclease P protein component
MATFPKSARLRRSPEFRKTFDLGDKMVCGPLVLYAAIRKNAPVEGEDHPSPPKGLRLGLVVSRKVGNAVVRNRVKRCLREAFRSLKSTYEPTSPWDQVDLIVLARPSAKNTSALDLKSCLDACMRRLNKSLVNRGQSHNSVRSEVPHHG